MCGENCPAVYITSSKNGGEEAGLGTIVYKNLVMTETHVVGYVPHSNVTITVSFETQRRTASGYIIHQAREAAA